MSNRRFLKVMGSIFAFFIALHGLLIFIFLFIIRLPIKDPEFLAVTSLVLEAMLFVSIVMHIIRTGGSDA